jgi:hypothetical protein
MSTMPEIGGRRPIPVKIEPEKSYWWCACGRSKVAAVLRRIAQGHRLYPHGIQIGVRRGGVVLRLQTLIEKADV